MVRKKKKKNCARCYLLTMWIKVFANINDRKINLTTTMYLAIYSLFFLFFFSHLPLSYPSTKIRSNKRGIQNNRVRIMRSKTSEKKGKNLVKWILVRNSGEWIITKVKITGFNCINILVLMGKNRFGATANTSEKNPKSPPGCGFNVDVLNGEPQD